MKARPTRGFGQENDRVSTGPPTEEGPSQLPALRFAGFELDEATYRLTRGGHPIRLEPKPLALLFHLVRHRDRVVTKEELRQLLWPDAIVSGDSLFHVVMKAREALGERGRKDGTIQTIRGRGFRFAAEVELLIDDTVPGSGASERSPLATRSLIGRGAELQRLREIHAATGQGSGRVALVEGPAGIGKSRLVREFVEGSSPALREIHHATSPESGGAPAYWLWVQILRSLLPVARESSFEDAPSIEALLAELTGAGGTALADMADADEAEFRLLDGLATSLRDHAEKQPIVLVLEDLQWVDSGSAKALAFLSDAIATVPILIVGTCRDVELGPDHPLERARVEWMRRDLLEAVPLAGLDPDDVTTLVEEVTGYEPDDGFIESLWTRTRGNPFFVRQILALALARTDPTEELGARLRSEVGTIPQEVRRVIRDRLARLDGPTQMVLSRAAAFGAEFDLAALARCVDLDRASLLRALERASAEQIITPRATLAKPYAFSHGLLREVAYAELDASERAQVHRRIAEALEELYADRIESIVPALARHYGDAAPLLESDEAVRYSKWAGDLARDSCAYQDAAEAFARAIRALDLLPDAPAERRAELLICSGFALQSAGRNEEGRSQHRAAMAHARSAGNPKLFAAAVLGLAEVGVGGNDPELLELLESLEEALAGLEAVDEDEGPLRIWLLSAVAVRAAPLGRLARAKAASHEAAERARASRDPSWLAWALASVSEVRRFDPETLPEQRLALLDEASERADDARNTSFAIVASVQRYGVLMELARRQEAERECERMAELVERSRSSYWGYLVPSLRSGLLSLDGDLPGSERLAHEAFDRSDGPHLQLASARAGSLAMIRYQQGRLSELLPAISALRAGSSLTGVLDSAEIAALIETGDDATARERLDEVAADDFQACLGKEAWILSLCTISEACEDLHDEARARTLYALLEPRADHAVIVDNGQHVHGPVAFFLGILAKTFGDLPLAEERLEHALDVANRLRSPVWRAHALGARASLAVAHGERAEARRLGREALGLADPMGLARVLRRLRALELT